MSTEKIAAGDTLTVGDLTDDHLGAVIEVGPTLGVTYRLRLDRIERYGTSMVKLWTAEGNGRYALRDRVVTVIAPPPVVQPDEPTIPGQCIKIEGWPEYLAVLVNPLATRHFVYTMGLPSWTPCTWDEVLDDASGRQIIVSDPPRWPDDTPVVPERIEVGEWPDDDTHLREWEWVDADGDLWRWGRGAWRFDSGNYASGYPVVGPWTRGERVE